MILQSDSVGASSNNPEWRLHTGNGPRVYDELVKFKEPFSEKPKVTVAIKHIDMISGDLRINVREKSVSKYNFEVEISTWSDTRIDGASVTWFAYDTRLEELNLLKSFASESEEKETE